MEITSLKKEIERLTLENQLLKEQAIKDPQTQLLNKRGLQEAEENIIAIALRDIAQAKEEERKIRTIFFDLNQLKEINDTQGHEAGDGLIKEIAQYLKEIAGRTEDIAARWGGDEFVLLLKNDTRRAEDYLEIQKRKYPHLKFSAGVVDIDLNNLYEEVTSEMNNGEKDYSKIEENMIVELRKSKELADAVMYEAKKLDKQNANFVFEDELTSE